MSDIRYIKRADIDVVKWDKCIDNAPNGLIYAYSFYLDSMCDNWDALILGDYEAVMPLPWRKKWNIKYVYQPPFLQRLGLFGNELTEEIKSVFFKKASKSFSFIHYNSTQPAQSATQKELENFFIDLNAGYPNIKENYTSESFSNLKKATARGCQFTTDIKPDEAITFFKNAYGKLNPQLGNQEYQRFRLLLEECNKRKMLLLAGVKDATQNTVFCASLLMDGKRIYYVLGAPTLEGRQKRAPYFFIDAVLKQFSGQPLLFDFEGSVIPSVAAFYKKFSPAVEKYYEIKINQLPPPLKWLK